MIKTAKICAHVRKEETKHLKLYLEYNLKTYLEYSKKKADIHSSPPIRKNFTLHEHFAVYFTTFD